MQLFCTCERLFSWATLGTLLAALAVSSAAKTLPPAAPTAPKLVVFLVVDGLPMRQVMGYRDQLAPDGFNRFLQRGATFNNAHYGHGYTVTAPGHSVMLTGAYPNRTGIIGNEWRDPATGETVYCAQDNASTYLGHKTAPLAGTSPKNLLAETVGDVLRNANPASKVIGISIKDRGAILPAGHAGTAYMYMAESGSFASSTFYMKVHPAWVEAFNATRPANAYFKKTWAPLLPESAYQRSAPDNQPWYRKDGNAPGLPAVIGAGSDAPGPRFYGDLIGTPFSDVMTLNFARAAIAGESLGRGPQTDILSISLSGHDYVNHAFGPESRLSHDHFLHLDRALQSFFTDLDRRVGKDNYVAVLTADHGFPDTPEWALSQGREAGRLNPGQVLSYLNAGLSTKFGDAQWIFGYSTAGILLNRQAIAAKELTSATIENEAKNLLLQIKGIANVFTRAQLAGTEATTIPYLASLRKSWHPEHSAQLYLVLSPGWILSGFPTGTSHGSPYSYDTHVPILFYGPRWVGMGQVERRVEVADIATTLSQLLQIATPAQSEGKILPLPAPK
jgi:hypothetical protein